MTSAPLPASSPESQPDLIVWTLEQLLEHVPMSRSTIYRWIEREGLPVVRVSEGSRPLFLRTNVLEWLAERETQKTVASPKPAVSGGLDTARLAELHRSARRPRSRRTPPPPIATAGTRDRLRRIHGAR
jgi:excisionase family DNA binding protein